MKKNIKMIALVLAAALMIAVSASALAKSEPISKTIEQSNTYDYGTLKITVDQWRHEFKKTDLRYFVAHVYTTSPEQLRTAFAGNHKAAGKQRIPGFLGNSILLAGDQGFVDLQPSLAQPGIGADLVSGREYYNIITYQLLRGYRHRFCVPDSFDGLGSYQCQPVYRPLGTDLLDAADHGIDNYDHQKGHVFHG